MASSGDVVSLQDLCVLTVSSYLSPFNVWSIHRLVPYAHSKSIECVVHLFICDNFMDISHTDQFLALDEKEMHWLFDNQDIKVSEAAMLDSLARWYKHSESQRENAFKQLFEKVHVSVIGRDVLSEVIKKYQLTRVIPELRKYKKLLPQFVNIDDLIYQENIANIAVLGLLRTFEPNSWQIDDTNLNVNYWMPLISKLLVSSPPILRHLGNELLLSDKYAVPFYDELFIMGPRAKRGNIRLDFVMQTVTHCTPCPEGLFTDFIAVPCGIFIFFIGGTDNMYRYDTVKDKWRELQPPIKYYSASFTKDAAVSYNNRYLYVFAKNSSEKYDMYTNTWTPLVSPYHLGDGGDVDGFDLRTISFRLSADTLSNMIYICVELRGGIHVQDSLASLHKCRSYGYHPTTDTWLSSYRHQFHCVARRFFGHNFFLHHKRPSFGRPGKLLLSTSDDDLYKEKKLVSVKGLEEHLNFSMDFSHMTVLSRGARMRIDQDKTVVYLQK